MKESPKDANIEALFDVETAFKRFFTGVADHPVFHTRSDVLHKATTQIASTYETVVIEDLSVAGMTRSGKGKERRKKAKINRSILDAGFREFRRQLEYKVPLHGGTLVITPRYYASSKRCSGCGHMKETLEITERIYTCEVCGQSCHRDKNAALNLCTLGWRGIDAHGQERRPEAEQSVRALLVEVRNKAGTLKNVQVL
jgi:putative transposase